jgi:hypothetical protein
MKKSMRNRCSQTIKSLALAVSAALAGTGAHAFNFETGPDWRVNLDNTLQYTMGWRAEGRDQRIGNDPFFHQGEYSFDRGDMVTNRIQDLIEFQAVYKDRLGFRLSGSVWKDWAYDDTANGNPALLAQGLNVYPGGHFRGDAKRFHIEGGELLDAFAFVNGSIGDVPAYLKIGRLTQHWGNAFYFGFNNIAYGQAAVDNIKGFSQPGSEVKELFLPRAQILATAELTPEFSVSGQYFFEFDGNRYPEGGTYFGAADFLYKGPARVPALEGALGGRVAAGREHKPNDNNQNFGIKATWSPEWAGGDLGFYYRQFDDVHPWVLLDANPGGGGSVNLRYAEHVKLYGLSYERTFGPASTALEVSYRKGTALNSIIGVSDKGASGDLLNVVANAFVQLGTTPFYDAGMFIAEVAYTHLVDVTDNKHLYNGKGFAPCVNKGIRDGCATKDALALWVSFEPQWLQALPSIDISMPMSYAWGVSGNPAYAAGGFYAEKTGIYSIGVKALYEGKTSVTLAYNGLNWEPGKVTSGQFGDVYASGNGAYALHNRDWVSLTLKTSF